MAKKAQDEAQLANAQVDLVRYQKLAETQYGSHQQADTQKALVAQYTGQLAQDQASIDDTKATLDYATIRSPIDGRTGIRIVDQGNIVHASDTTGIVTIAEIKPIAAIFNLPQQWLRQVNPAQAQGNLKLEARDGDNGEVLDTGTLQVIDNTVDQTTGTVRMKGSFPNANGQLWPGQFVNLRLYVDTLHDVVVVPTPAVQRGPDGAFVYVVKDDKVAMTKVTTGRQTETVTVLTAGLAPPADVVTTGFTRLTDGAKVSVSRPAQAGDVPGPPRRRRPIRPRPGGRPRSQRERHQACSGGRRRSRSREGRRGAEGPSSPPPYKDRRSRTEPRATQHGRERGTTHVVAAPHRPDGSPVNISAPFILRPIATALLAVAVLLAGLMGYRQLSVSSLPQVDFPTIQVSTQLPGANPDTISSLVTASLERQFGQIPALASMSSQSSFGLSQITLQFNLDRDIDAAAQDVQSAINAAASTLPHNLPYPPTYSKVNPADTPVLTLALTSRSVPLRDLSDVADTLLAPRISQVSGVGHVSVEGNIRPAVRIQADLSRLAAYGISMEDLRAAIVAANVAGSKGSLDGTAQAYTIAANDQIDAAKSYESVVIAYRNGAPVLLRDVAQVIDGLENSRVGGWYAGEPAVIIDVQRQPGANVVETVDRVLAELPRLQRSLAAGVTLKVVHDSTDTIRASIRDVEFTLVLSAGLVVLVVLLFLRTVRATIIAGVALPLSIIATFGVMWAAGFSLDNLSLMALTIGTGFVVDDAIVMIENVVRNIEDGEAPLEAALRGAREIGFTVVSLTVSLIAVFIPLLFMTGIVGRMFREFALTLTFAVIVSAVISLTLTPMMCGRLLKPAPRHRGDREPWLMRVAEAPVALLARGYEATLGWALRRQGLMLFVTLATLGLTVWLYVVVPKGFLPVQDTGLIDVVLEGSPAASFAEMSRLQAQAEAALRQDPDITGVVAVLGVGTLNPTSNVAHLQLTLRSSENRKDNAQAVAERVRSALARIPGATPYVKPVQDIQIATEASRSQYQYTLTGTDTAAVTEWSSKLVAALRRDPLFAHVAAEVQDGGLRAFVDIDRQKAGRLGVTTQMIDDTLNDAFGQRQISTIYAQSNQYRVILEAAPRYDDDPTILDKLYVGVTNGTTSSTTSTGGVTTAATTTASTPGAQVPLVSFATLKRTTAPLAVAHQEQFPAAAISFDLPQGVSLGEAVNGIAIAERDIGMPAAIVGQFGADAAEFTKSLAGEPWLVLAAVVTIYLVLGILYESFIHPLTILSTLPSAGVGALLALMATGQELSIVALIGIILLMGIVKKNAIMMIDFATAAERDDGLSPFDAIERACRLRFRPIMMTTLAALFGAIPLALAHGSGAELRMPLGITIIGGLLLSQLLTLYTTPVIYLQMEALGRRFGIGHEADRAGDEEAEPEMRRAAE